ncbi:hypothetical protein DFH06DRAFT_1121723 [Mycena polygramma]|nr:hypothetical protein DFH06DRAFT_1121723 [Mycena polygramma]
MSGLPAAALSEGRTALKAESSESHTSAQRKSGKHPEISGPRLASAHRRRPKVRISKRARVWAVAMVEGLSILLSAFKLHGNAGSSIQSGKLILGCPVQDSYCPFGLHIVRFSLKLPSRFIAQQLAKLTSFERMSSSKDSHRHPEVPRLPGKHRKLVSTVRHSRPALPRPVTNREVFVEILERPQRRPQPPEPSLEPESDVAREYSPSDNFSDIDSDDIPCYSGSESRPSSPISLARVSPQSQPPENKQHDRPERSIAQRPDNNDGSSAGDVPFDAIQCAQCPTLFTGEWKNYDRIRHVQEVHQQLRDPDMFICSVCCKVLRGGEHFDRARNCASGHYRRIPRDHYFEAMRFKEDLKYHNGHKHSQMLFCVICGSSFRKDHTFLAHDARCRVGAKTTDMLLRPNTLIYVDVRGGVPIHNDSTKHWLRVNIHLDK